MLAADATIALDDYRRLVSLDERFAPRDDGTRDPAALLRVALEFLEEEAGGDVPPEDDARRRLQALLTARPPAPLPGDVCDAIDGLLQRERSTRAVTATDALPRFALDGRGGSSAYALWQGDITTLGVDAIVNAANARLLNCFSPFHACIDNAIHAAAGPRLREDCHRIMQAQGHLEPTGVAKVTRAYHLPSRFVVHTVGPIVRGALTRQHESDLARSYQSCLEVAARVGARSLAFCAISTGVFGFPGEPAARIALATVRDWIASHRDAPELVVFNVFSNRDREIYRDAIREFTP